VQVQMIYAVEGRDVEAEDVIVRVAAMRLMSRTRSRSSLVSEYKFGTYRFGITSAWNSALGDRSRKASNSDVSA